MDSTAGPTKVHDAGPERNTVVARPRHRQELPAYFLPDTDLEMGASLGNTRCWATIKGNGDVESLFSTHLGQVVVGSTCLRYSGVGHRIIRPGRKAEAASVGLPYNQFKVSANHILTVMKKPFRCPVSLRRPNTMHCTKTRRLPSSTCARKYLVSSSFILPTNAIATTCPAISR
jgi:hypothetical protein